MGSLFQNTMQVNTWASLVLMVLMAPSFPMPGGCRQRWTLHRV